MAYRLAALMRTPYVRRMLRGMSRQELLHWEVFLQLEPQLDERMAWHTAQVVQALWNIARDRKKHSEPFKIEEFLLRFGDDRPAGPTRKQTWKQQKDMFKLITEALAEPKAQAARAARRAKRTTATRP